MTIAAWVGDSCGRDLGHLRRSESTQDDKIDEVGSFTEARRSRKLKRIVARSNTDRLMTQEFRVISSI